MANTRSDLYYKCYTTYQTAMIELRDPAMTLESATVTEIGLLLIGRVEYSPSE